MVKLRKEENLYLKILPYNEQQYRAIYANRFCFLDSYQFLFASLDALIKDYKERKNPEKMHYTKLYISVVPQAHTNKTHIRMHTLQLQLHIIHRRNAVLVFETMLK